MAEASPQLAQLVQRLHRLTPLQLGKVERLVARLESVRGGGGERIESGDGSPHSKDWPHAPLHRLGGKGTYLVTAGTLG